VSTPSSISRRRFVPAYGLAAIAVTAAAAVMIAAGQDHEAEPEIAGGYDVTAGASCAGQRFDLKQSGRFVDLQNGTGTLGGALKLENSRLTGDVDCVGGGSEHLAADVHGPALRGRLGDGFFAADLSGDLPVASAQRRRTPDSVAGKYELSPHSDCLGDDIELKGGGSDVKLVGNDRTLGRARYAEGVLRGRILCPRGGPRALRGVAVERTIEFELTDPRRVQAGERVTAQKQRDEESLFAAFFIAVGVAMLAARAVGTVAVKTGQPRVMGEAIAGIALGPSLLGALAPSAAAAIFPQDIVPYLGLAAQLGLIFYMFLIGLELDLAEIRARAAQISAISNASVALPLIMGIALALPLYEALAPDTKFASFALFMGISMSITAFPVLARILVERRLIKRPIGGVVLAAAAIDDVTAWLLVALATAITVAGSPSDIVVTIALAALFCLFMVGIVRRGLARVSTAYDEAGRVPGGWIALIFAGVLLSAWATQEIGVALIFGAFVMGLIMPRHAGLTEDVTRRLEDFVVILLLPLFFVFTGLRTDLGLLNRPVLWVITVVVLLVALAGKLVGAALAARLTGFDWRSSAVVGTLMNTRGMTELIVLNLALDTGVISPALFTMLVIMALVTTLIAGPLLRLLDPKNELGVPIEEELEVARQLSMAQFPDLQLPEEAVLVAPQSDGAMPQLISLAEPLARSEPPRELIIAQLLRPTRGAAARGGLQTERRLLEETTNHLNDVRFELMERGVAARAVAFVSPDRGEDISKLAESEEVSLLLIDGYRPLIGGGVPRGDVGTVLREAPCDVAVLVARESMPVAPGPDSPVIAPFGGAEHDWAALELGAWIAAATSAPLKLLGAAGQADERARVSRLLGDAGVLVRQYAGVATEPLLAEPGREGIVEAAAGAGLLVVGLSDRWQHEGLGPTRSELARAAPAPVLFVRRGARAGALAPREDVTRFTWSMPGAGRPGTRPVV
jgi:Kef-type K+ transport system membrane component KefB